MAVFFAGLPDLRTGPRRSERSRTSSTVAVQKAPTLLRTAIGMLTRLLGTGRGIAAEDGLQEPSGSLEGFQPGMRAVSVEGK